MYTFEKVKGAPIFVQGTKRVIGKIIDLVISKEEAHVIGVFLLVKKWRSRRRFILWDDIIIHGETGIFSTMSIAVLKELPEGVRRFSHGGDRLHGNLIYKTNGDAIGIIEDVYFLPNSGKIIGYEMTEGLFSDMKDGIKMLKCTTPFIEQEGSFFIKSES